MNRLCYYKVSTGENLAASVADRNHVFLGLLDPAPDPLVRCMDPDPAPDPSIIKQKW